MFLFCHVTVGGDSRRRFPPSPDHSLSSRHALMERGESPASMQSGTRWTILTLQDAELLGPAFGPACRYRALAIDSFFSQSGASSSPAPPALAMTSRSRNIENGTTDADFQQFVRTQAARILRAFAPHEVANWKRFHQLRSPTHLASLGIVDDRTGAFNFVMRNTPLAGTRSPRARISVSSPQGRRSTLFRAKGRC